MLPVNFLFYFIFINFLFLADQIFYRSCVDGQHFLLRSFASSCFTVMQGPLVQTAGDRVKPDLGLDQDQQCKVNYRADRTAN